VILVDVVLQAIRVLVSLATFAIRALVGPLYKFIGSVVAVQGVILETIGVLVGFATSRHRADIWPLKRLVNGRSRHG
jgi:hypothetical protein